MLRADRAERVWHSMGMKRRFEFQEGGSSKFWEIARNGAAVQVGFGKLGTAGQKQEKTYASEAEASRAVDKQIKEKTGKGYLEVASDADAVNIPPSDAAEPASAAKKAAKGARAEKPAAVEPLTLLNRRVLSARTLANIAAKLEAAGTPTETSKILADATAPLAMVQDRRALTAHLAAQGLFAWKAFKRCHLGIAATTPGFPFDGAIEVLSAVEPDPNQYDPSLRKTVDMLVSRLHDEDASRLRAARPRLSPFARSNALLVAALRGEQLSREEGALAGDALCDLVGQDGRGPIALGGPAAPQSAEALHDFLLSIAGPDWIRRYEGRLSSLPYALAGHALANEPLSFAIGALNNLNDREILAARKDPPATLFELAFREPEEHRWRADVLGILGAARAGRGHVPEGLEATWRADQIQTRHGVYEALSALGTERLDRWAMAQLDEVPGEEAYFRTARTTGVWNLLRHEAPFGPSVFLRLFATEKLAHASDVRAYVERFRNAFDPPVAKRVLELLVPLAETFEQRDEDDAPSLAGVATRLAIVHTLNTLEDPPLPAFDRWVRPEEATYYEDVRGVKTLLEKLPAARAEAILRRAIPRLASRWDEIVFLREGLSDGYLERAAALIVAGREGEELWSVGSKLGQGKTTLADAGDRLGPPLARAFAAVPVGKRLLDRLQSELSPGAFETLKASLGTTETPAQELARLCKSLGGPTTPIFLMSTGKAAKASTLSRVGGRPVGVAPDEVPRHGKRKLAHAFTIDLESVPELASRFPGARTVSLYVQAYAESERRAHALVVRTDAELTRDPGDEKGAEELLFERAEVPVAVFDDAPEASFLRAAIYRSAGHLLGGPLWLQQGERGVDPKFLAQFDERLGHGVNLGDMGLCYVHEGTATWQCH